MKSSFEIENKLKEQFGVIARGSFLRCLYLAGICRNSYFLGFIGL